MVESNLELVTLQRHRPLFYVIYQTYILVSTQNVTNASVLLVNNIGFVSTGEAAAQYQSLRPVSTRPRVQDT